MPRELALAAPAQLATFRGFARACALAASRGRAVEVSPAGLEAWPAWLRRQAERLTLTYCARPAQGGLTAGAEAPTPGGDPGRAPSAPWQPPGPGLGAWAPGQVTLLVGDRPGPGWRARLNWPFISALRSGCSAWLADQLEAAGVPEAALYWVNSHDQAGRAASAGFLRELAPAHVVALGKYAAGWCDRVLPWYDLEFTQVHHPQHWKRFHSGDRYHLVKLLGQGGYRAR